MKVLLCHNYYRQPGGEDRVFEDEAALLEARGHRVLRYTAHNDDIGERDRVGLAVRTVWNAAAAREVGRLVAAEGADVVHFHNTLPQISPAAYYAARRAGAAVVQTLHNYRLLCPKAVFFRDGRVCEDCLHRSVPWPAVRHRCYRGSTGASAAVAAMLAAHRLLGTYHRAVDAYIALSRFSRDKFVEGGLPAERVHVKPNFVHPDPGPRGGAGGYALFLGRLSPEKGVETLLAAWRRLPRPVPLKVVGAGPLEGLVRDAARAVPGVEWLGARPHAEVVAWLGDAAFLVLPSLSYEGFPKTIVEAYGVGTPVLGSRLGAVGELIEHGRTGLHFEPGDADGLARSAAELFGDGARLERMRRAARERYEALYTADRNYESLMRVYQAALRRREQPAARPRAEAAPTHRPARGRLPLPAAGPADGEA